MQRMWRVRRDAGVKARGGEAESGMTIQYMTR